MTDTLKMNLDFTPLDKYITKALDLGRTPKGNTLLKKATQVALKPIVAKIKEVAPKDTGVLRKNIKLYVDFSKKSARITSKFKSGVNINNRQAKLNKTKATRKARSDAIYPLAQEFGYHATGSRSLDTRRVVYDKGNGRKGSRIEKIYDGKKLIPGKFFIRNTIKSNLTLISNNLNKAYGELYENGLIKQK